MVYLLETNIKCLSIFLCSQWKEILGNNCYDCKKKIPKFLFEIFEEYLYSTIYISLFFVYFPNNFGYLRALRKLEFSSTRNSNKVAWYLNYKSRNSGPINFGIPKYFPCTRQLTEIYYVQAIIGEHNKKAYAYICTCIYAELCSSHCIFCPAR